VTGHAKPLNKCFARVLFLPRGVIPIKSLLNLLLTFAVLAEDPVLDAHTAVEASTLFSRNLVVEESHLPPRFFDCIIKTRRS